VAGIFHIQNFGCRAAQADGASLERALMQRGMRHSGDVQQANVAILNTCTVTAAADADARAAVRRIHRENPECKILVTGCYAQRAPLEISELPGVSWVVGNSHKHGIAELIAPAKQSFFPLEKLTQVFVGDIFAHTELMAAPVFDSVLEKTRPNLKVQDGCNNRCSFCVIPSVRGQSRSLALAEVICETRQLVALGYREIVLSGINLGRWGRDLQSQLRFEDLLRAVLAETEIEKIRVSSVEPMDWSDELIEMVATHPRIARHAHVPLQSGSDKILRLMHRKYRPWHYAERIRKIRAAAPDAAIGADVMVGFPGETNELFEQSREFIASLPFTYLHVFTFSARPGTPAATMPQQVPGEVARERNRILRELAALKNLEFRQSFIGRELSAITLHERDDQYSKALTDNYLKLRLRGEHQGNRWVTAHIEELTPEGLIGSAKFGEQACSRQQAARSYLL
jgi:threonylcarbamoyladenosine tRNA methylthiotransferase MtaB